jgi:hypothetical protein
MFRAITARFFYPAWGSIFSSHPSFPWVAPAAAVLLLAGLEIPLLVGPSAASEECLSQPTTAFSARPLSVAIPPFVSGLYGVASVEPTVAYRIHPGPATTPAITACFQAKEGRARNDQALAVFPVLKALLAWPNKPALSI